MAVFLRDTLDALWRILLDSGVWLLLGLALAGIVHVFVPPGFLTRHLASRDGGRFAPILKASLLGIPLPLCSCSVIPVAAGLRRSGAGRGASAAFAISTPQTGEESIPLTWALFGPVFALARPVIAVATALTAGLLIERLAPDRVSRATPEESDAKPCCASVPLTVRAPGPPKPCCSGGGARGTEPAPAAPCCGSAPTPRAGLGARTGSAIRHGFGTMLVDLAPWLAIGLALSAIAAAAVPEGWIAEHVGAGLGPMLLMLVVGIPLYVCATSSTPLAFVLVGAGLSPGAALVLLLAGPATNAATMTWVIKDLGVRALAVYLGVIGAFAIGAGLAFDALLAGTVRLADHAHAHDHAAVGAAQAAAAGLFALLLLWAVGVRAARAARSRGTGGTAPAIA